MKHHPLKPVKFSFIIALIHLQNETYVGLYMLETEMKIGKKREKETYMLMFYQTKIGDLHLLAY